MTEDQEIAVKDAVHKLQLCLVKGIHDENKLFAAGSLMSQNDYQDLITERSIASLCGYPLCSNNLKEHKVYDSHETYMYCSTSCMVNSRAFAASLQEERCSSLNPVKINQVLSLFEGLSLEDSKEDLGNNSNLESSKLRIQEKSGTTAREVHVEEWIRQSNAIEGFVPQEDQSAKSEGRVASEGQKTEKKGKQPDKAQSKTVVNDNLGYLSNEMRMKLLVSDSITGPGQLDLNNNTSESAPELQAENASASTANVLKSSSESTMGKRGAQSVTWADEKSDSNRSKSLCEFRELEDKKHTVTRSDTAVRDVKAFVAAALSEVEIVNLERVGIGQKNFDMAIVFKDFKKDVMRIDSIPSTSLDDIKEWLDTTDVKYYESRLNLCWRPILKAIMDDPEKFAENGGWKFLNIEVSDSDSEDSDELDQEYVPSNAQSDSGSEEEDDDSESLVESENDEEEDSEEFSEEEDGKKWEGLEREASNADREEGHGSDREEDREKRKMKTFGKDWAPERRNPGCSLTKRAKFG